jgi:deoxyribonuclease-1
MDELPGEKRAYGRCDVEIRERKIEPKPSIRGDIARTYMYMNWAYPGRGIIGRKRAKLFKRWSAQDPVDRWERERVRKIEKIQGNKNPFVR